MGTADRGAALRFWGTVLGYDAVGADRLVDPDRRHPRLALVRHDAARPLRERFHVDVVRPAAAVQEARAALGAEPYGVYGLTLADPDGTEVDLVPGEPLSERPGTSDWHAVFGAVARYPGALAQAGELVVAVAREADEAGLPLLIDVRPDATTVDSGKDRWEDDVSGGGFVDLAARVQAVAHGLGYRAGTALPRFVQVGLDAVDVPAVREFWTRVLGYQQDERPHVTDLYDPRRLGPVLMFQPTDAGDPRLQQPGAVRLELVVPPDQADARVEAALAAGGRVVRESPGRRTLADPEGNELDLVTEP